MRPALPSCGIAFSIALAACSGGSGVPGAGSHDDSPQPVYATCQDSFVPVYLNVGPGATNTMVTAGDGLFYLASSSSILYFPPGATVDTPPVTVVAGPPGGSFAVESFWAEGDSLLLVTNEGLATVPASGGELTFLTTYDDEQTMAQALHLVQDGTAIYGAFATLSSTSPQGVTPVTVVSQPVSGGPVDTLATLQLPGVPATLQLFDVGSNLWLQDDDGDVFSVAKSGGAVNELGSITAALLFVPAGDAGMYGATQTNALASFRFDRTVTPLFGAQSPAFLANAGALDADGTLYVAGEASSSATTANPAIAVVPPGGKGSLLRCSASADVWIAALALGTTVGYAAVSDNGSVSIVRFAM
jgi:hypothetical protein